MWILATPFLVFRRETAFQSIDRRFNNSGFSLFAFTLSLIRMLPTQ